MELLDLKGKSGVRASYSPDGKRIVTVADDNRSKVGGGWDLKRQYNTVKLWDAKTGISLRELSGQIGFVQSVSFSPDSRRFVTGGSALRDSRIKSQVWVWDAETGSPLFELKGRPSWTMDVNLQYVGSGEVCFSPDGSRIAAVGGKTRAWNAVTGAPLFELQSGGTCVCFSPNGTRIVTSGAVWDAETGTPLLALKGHAGLIQCVCYSPDGTRIVTGSRDRTAKVWDAKTGTALLDLKGHPGNSNSGGVQSVCFSPDGTRIVTGGGMAKVWDARIGIDLAGEHFSKDMQPGRTNRDGRNFARVEGDREHSVDRDLSFDEWDYRLFWTRPRRTCIERNLTKLFRTVTLLPHDFIWIAF